MDIFPEWDENHPVVKLVTTVIGLVILTSIVLPRRSNSAAVITAFGESYGRMMKAMVYVEARDPHVTDLLNQMSDNDRQCLYRSLTPKDIEWLDRMMKDAWNV